jgi:hypothetical protein
MTESVIRADHRIGQRIRRERRDGLMAVTAMTGVALLGGSRT